MVKVSLEFSRKDAYWFAVILVFAVGVGFVVAYGGNNPSVVGHSAGELEINASNINISIGGTIKSVQQAFDDHNFITADMNGDGVVSIQDLEMLTALWQAAVE